MDIPNAVNIAILGGCESTVTFLHTFNHERMSRRAHNTIIPSTQSYHLRPCTLDEDEVMVVTREFETERLENPHLLHCFGTGTEPPDGFIIVYDPTWSFSLDEAEGLLAAVVGATWGPRLVELEIIRRRLESSPSPSPSSSGSGRLWKRSSKFKYFPRLPYDLQLAVLRACLVSPEAIIDQKPHLNGINVNLLLVNKFCYREGGKIYRSENRFLPLPPICLVADSSTGILGSGGDSGDHLVDKGRQLAEKFGVGFVTISCESKTSVDGVVMGIVRRFIATGEGILKHRQRPRRSVIETGRTVFGRIMKGSIPST
ncbi:hypothetical protein ASPVEDRAFT_81307 [Aspergillus versicolor CBS 583.65]|uniref:Uncharacterized protein n=1 Tax=Aspergillus versicolor CBS 583.65 TaxID=1036611 RepID=A0A1L9PDZ0_ASPVE|nr:uncharacterized protein ASPVEDRAFT_81307 [Aspergillus versicolor CBS 583.65]OJI99712.1 hypothetical protein ASPVEDRAFT_81307 [Aspergillus versicolor CBS 583.65]